MLNSYELKIQKIPHPWKLHDMPYNYCSDYTIIYIIFTEQQQL